MNFAVGGTGGRTSTHTSGVPATRVNLNYVAASSKLAFIGETSLAVLPNPDFSLSLRRDAVAGLASGPNEGRTLCARGCDR
jgi:hypothetical protein